MRILAHMKSDWFLFGFEMLAVIVGILIGYNLVIPHNTIPPTVVGDLMAKGGKIG